MFYVFTKDPMEQYRNQKYFDVLIFYVVLIVYSFCCLANLSCHLVHLVCRLAN